jgi:hypothetical protein
MIISQIIALTLIQTAVNLKSYLFEEDSLDLDSMKSTIYLGHLDFK